MMSISPHIRILLRTAVFLAAGVPVAWIDLRTRRIPDALSLGGLAALFAFDLLSASPELLLSAASALFAFLLFALVRRVTKGLGFGDVKYAALLGFFTGPRLLPAAFLVAAAAGLAYAFAAVRFFGMPRGARAAFGPFLSAGGLVAAAYMLI